MSSYGYFLLMLVALAVVYVVVKLFEGWDERSKNGKTIHNMSAKEVEEYNQRRLSIRLKHRRNGTENSQAHRSEIEQMKKHHNYNRPENY